MTSITSREHYSVNCIQSELVGVSQLPIESQRFLHRALINKLYQLIEEHTVKTDLDTHNLRLKPDEPFAHVVGRVDVYSDTKDSRANPHVFLSYTQRKSFNQWDEYASTNVDGREGLSQFLPENLHLTDPNSRVIIHFTASPDILFSTEFASGYPANEIDDLNENCNDYCLSAKATYTIELQTNDVLTPSQIDDLNDFWNNDCSELYDNLVPSAVDDAIDIVI